MINPQPTKSRYLVFQQKYRMMFFGRIWTFWSIS